MRCHVTSYVFFVAYAHIKVWYNNVSSYGIDGELCSCRISLLPFDGSPILLVAALQHYVY